MLKRPVRWPLLIEAVVVVIVLVGAVGARAASGRAKTTQAPALSAADYVEIQQLAVRYSYALDSGANNGEAFADLFAPDGAFISATRGRIAGRDPLVALGRGRTPMYPRRFIVNHVITPTADGAAGKAYVIEVDLPSEGEKLGGALSATGGRYEDAYEKTPAGWRFRSREFVPSKMAVPGAGASPSAPPASAAPPAPPISPAPPASPVTEHSIASAPPFAGRGREPEHLGGGAAPNAKLAALTPSDYIEIQQLVARYGYALDTGADEGTGSVYGDLFTADGVFVGPGIADDTQGREKLTALARIAPGSRTRRGPRYVSHYLFNHLIEPSPQGAVGKVYLLVINPGQDSRPTAISMGGHYEDVYARTPQGWRFKKREFVRGKVSVPPDSPASSLTWTRVREEPKRSAGVAGLSAMDYIEIRKLIASYAYALDTGTDNGYMYADLFAPDAVVFAKTTGRENIADLARREPHGPQFVRHFLTNVVIEPAAGGAIGRQYVAVIDVGDNTKPSAFFLLGKYEDAYVRTPQGWRFKSRNIGGGGRAAPPGPN